MPGFLTHYLSGQKMLDGFGQQQRNLLLENEKLFNLGTQGPDIFFYYFPGVFYSSVRGLGSVMHDQDLGKFLIEMAAFAKTSKNHMQFAYVCGFIMHYALDSVTHPYVFARSFDPRAKTIKNKADHRVFETALDVMMLSSIKGMKPNDLSHYSLINASANELRSAAHIVSSSIAPVYNRAVTLGQIYSAMKFMITFTRLLQSQKGKRKRLVCLVERLTVRQPLFSSMIHDQETSLPVLNLENKEWQAHWDGAVPDNSSFVQLFDKAVGDGIKICEAAYSLVYENADESQLGAILGNRSLVTGFET